jgi:hypothetical protein
MTDQMESKKNTASRCHLHLLRLRSPLGLKLLTVVLSRQIANSKPLESIHFPETFSRSCLGQDAGDGGGRGGV